MNSDNIHDAVWAGQMEENRKKETIHETYLDRMENADDAKEKSLRDREDQAKLLAQFEEEPDKLFHYINAAALTAIYPDAGSWHRPDEDEDAL